MGLFVHQDKTAEFKAAHPRCFNTSDPGTGKTVSSIEAFTRSRQNKGKLLVFCPLSIMQPSWLRDIEKFYPDLVAGIAHGTRRNDVMLGNYDIVITNHDAVKWIIQNPKLLEGVTHVVVDEFTVYKNRTAQRSKALKKITDKIEHLWMLSGTPNSNSNLDIWYPALLVDKGERLGRKFFEFRHQVCAPQQVGPKPEHIQWLDKPGAEFDVADRLKDITIRFRAEDCIDLPEHRVTTMALPMPGWLAKQYKQMLELDYLEIETEVVTSIHAAARAKKLLQLLSGAVYNSEGKAVRVHTARYDLIADLIEAREQCVVAFNYKHERDHLEKVLNARNISYGIIDGDTPLKAREQCVEDFQNHKLKVILAHPQSAGHGLTLTAGTTTLWCSPTYNGEHYTQFNRRIYRAGQTQKTETIRVAYENTKEIEVYDKLDNKLVRMDSLLELFNAFTECR